MVYMIESQIAYVLDALRAMRARGAGVVEVRPEVEAALQRGGPATHAGHGLEHAAARAGTRTRTATTRRCGRTGRGASGGAPRAFDPSEYVLGMTRVIITGAAGGIGSATVDALRERGAQVVGLDLPECDVRSQGVRAAPIAFPVTTARWIPE